MSEAVVVHLDLAGDTPSSMRFEDTYRGLENIWYKFSADESGNVELWATPDGFEHLARYFLKLARGRKVSGYHAHHSLEFGPGPVTEGPELTIGVVESPPPVA
jgi:hypothetical protein